MVRWHHQLNRREFEQTPGDSKGQGGLLCCSWGHTELDMTERLNKNVQIIVMWDIFQLQWISELYALEKASCKEICQD